MTYNPENAKEIPKLDAGIVVEGAIIKVDDGKVKDHIHEDAKQKWEKSLESPAIKVVAQCLHNDVPYQTDNVFTYINENGLTKYGERSNLGKFKAYYKALPSIGLKVQLKTNAKGYFRLVIE